MKFNLLTKYLFVYAAVALLGFLGVTFISYRIDYAKVYNYYTDALYKQALSISSEYADDYFSEEHLRIVETELRTVALLNDTRIMFIDTAGNIILDTAYAQEHNTKDILYTINGFDYTSLGTKHTQTGDFYGMLDCTCLSVFAPITSSFTMKGYVVVHLDENVIKIARQNAANAGVDKLIHFQARDVRQLSHAKKYGFVITNPPYGERLEEKEALPALYTALGQQFAKLDSWSAYVITSYTDIEKYFGRKADKNRKIYNGMLKTYFYSFLGPKPPKKNV